MPDLKYWKAINEAMAEEMDRDRSVVLIGEDVGKPGGTYVASKGLYERFGAGRVRDTPISEGILIGLATGASMTGLRVIVEIMFLDFLTLASDQLVNHAAKVRYASGGAFGVPMVMRTICGAGKNTGPQHGQNLEAWVAHVPGLKVVWPSNPADAKGMLKAAVRDPDPVVVVESLALWMSRGEVPEGDHLVPLGTAAIAREGSDVTLVSWGSAVARANEAAETLAGEHGVSAEVLDLRSLSPLDDSAVLRSLAKTGRLVIVHDAVRQFGAGAEVAALAVGEGFGSLRAPIRRLAAPLAPVPFPTELEQAYFPQAAGIVEAALASVGEGPEPAAGT
jgi:pyruvate/2-oxoglutarate/acetoin dehydrogenase E1 component